MEILSQEEQTAKTRSFHPPPNATHVTSGKIGHSPQVWCIATQEEREKGHHKDKVSTALPEETNFIYKEGEGIHASG